MCIRIQYLSFSFWLTSLCIIGSRFVHLIRTDSNAFLFMATVYLYHSFFIHSSIDGHWGCFHVLAIVNSASVNNGIHLSFSTLVSLRYMPRSWIAGSYGGITYWVWVSSRSWWWTGKSGVLQSMGSQKVGHNWATSLHLWPSNPTAGHTHQGNQNWKRHVYPNVHCSTVYNSQDMEAT